MKGIKFITVTELKQQATVFVSEVEKSGRKIIVTKNGKPVVLLRKVDDSEFSVQEEKGKGK